jgi:UDP-N-acetylglucosamine 2-epimerase (non-hydrolysing)
MKVAPVIEALREHGGVQHTLVHTGQHYDDAMSGVFLEQLGVGAPDHQLEIGSGSHAQQTARVMERLEPLLSDLRPGLVLVPGDVNSTMAAALVAAKLRIPVGHIEAGLRSFDRTMPEEINRIVTDAISDLLFVHSPEAIDHLTREGATESAIHYVGNTMIDTLVRLREPIAEAGMPARLGLDGGGYLVVTLHRPALVDGDRLGEAVAALATVAESIPVVFPVHPRTRAALARTGVRDLGDRFQLIDPLGYLEFMSLVQDAAGVLTDSGGIQEETTFLGVPCFTLRENTERPVTVEMGTNRLLGLAPARITEIPGLLARERPTGRVPPLWDGRAASRIVSVLEAWAGSR